MRDYTIFVIRLLLLYLIVFIAFWIWSPITSESYLEAVVMAFAVSLITALVTSAVTNLASLKVIAFVGFLGFVSLIVGVYFWITVPDGILDVFFVLFGSGIFLSEVLISLKRYSRSSSF